MIDFIIIPEEKMKILKKNEKWLEQLKEFSNIEIELDEEISIEGEDPLQVLRTKEVLRAFGRGFDFETALNLLDEEYTLEIVEVKDYAGKSKNRQVVLKGRVIGREGKIKKMIEKFTEVKISVYGKTVGIIGKFKDVALAKKAVEMLLCGSMYSSVYQFLERSKRS